MKNCAVIFGICTLPLAGLCQGNPALQPVVGRTIYHADDSRTESVRDPNTREMTETTYNTAGQLTVKKVFLLNEKGEPTQGNVYDGRGNLIARCQSFYDEFGRRKEDQLTNLQGQVFQRVIHEYGKDGKALTPKVVNVNTGAAPTIKPAAVDFTGQPQGGNRYGPAITPGAAAPATGQPAQQPATPAEEPAKPKPNFFKKLFKKSQ